MYIDTHCHLSHDDYENIDVVIKNAEQANVKKLIISGCDKKSIKESIEIAAANKNIYLSLGYHPSEAILIEKRDIDNLKKILFSEEKIVAIGEIGLDYYWKKDNKEQQKWLFKEQLKLAQELNLPVVIHSRDAFQDTYDILKENKVTGVIHCFSGNIETAKMYIELGFYLGIGGVLTFKNSNLKNIIKEISLDKIISETDSPYLTPEPYRGSKNEPKYIPLIIKKIAEEKNIDIKEVEAKLEQNTRDLYNI